MTPEEFGRKVSQRAEEFGDWLVRTEELEALGLGRRTLAYAEWLKQHRLRPAPPASVGWVRFMRMPDLPKNRLSYAPRLPHERLQ